MASQVVVFVPISYYLSKQLDILENYYSEEQNPLSIFFIQLLSLLFIYYFYFLNLLRCRSLASFPWCCFHINFIMFIRTAGNLRKLSFRRTKSFFNLCHSVAFLLYSHHFHFLIFYRINNLYVSQVVVFISTSIQTAGNLTKLSFRRTKHFVNLHHISDFVM